MYFSEQIKTDDGFTHFYRRNNSYSNKHNVYLCKFLDSIKASTFSNNVNNKYNPGYDELKRAFDALKPHCYIGNGAQEVKIQNASSMTRAELIRYLEAIQHAYDYYLSVN